MNSNSSEKRGIFTIVEAKGQDGATITLYHPIFLTLCSVDLIFNIPTGIIQLTIVL